ncbi:hypothetical protein EV685_0058 [Sphaerotilus mobilis]|uniref:Uncharacterized protein n=1 Tax=Sphaerotilus mobilis TaxID=47994 RepID=A0A4Q7M6H3_9BURK|nr:hypothetical protein EV685_0058 [Sphaerotilus mobilis]
MQQTNGETKVLSANVFTNQRYDLQNAIAPLPNHRVDHDVFNSVSIGQLNCE